MARTFELRPLDADTADAFSRLLAQSFVVSAAAERAALERQGFDQIRVLYGDGELVGGLAQLPMGQWFGGRSVPMVGIASVAIAPHHRGSGAALTLMERCLRELHQAEVPLSTLYPAVQRLYHRAGYGQGGSRYLWEVEASALSPQPAPLSIVPLLPTAERLQPLYQQQAPVYSGHLDRSPYFWQTLLRQGNDTPLYAYGLGANATEGYVVFTQHPGKHTVLRVRDWGILSRAAAQSLWSLLASHRSQVDRIVWRSGALDILGWALPEQITRPAGGLNWMTRIVHLPQALLSRGYPPLSGELHLQVTDPLLAANTGAWVLRLEAGQPQVVPGGRGELQLSIQTLATLYTGLWSAPQLQRQGALEGPVAAVDLAATLFSGGSPWMPDFF